MHSFSPQRNNCGSEKLVECVWSNISSLFICECLVLIFFCHPVFSVPVCLHLCSQVLQSSMPTGSWWTLERPTTCSLSTGSSLTTRARGEVSSQHAMHHAVPRHHKVMVIFERNGNQVVAASDSNRGEEKETGMKRLWAKLAAVLSLLKDNVRAEQCFWFNCLQSLFRTFFLCNNYLLFIIPFLH